MADKIRLLPDAIANQIAAGEVIQRPASVVKELLENAIDSGATHIKVLIKGAGKTLVQIIDNGCGMSETDARMCFEKHATSKIRTADDLFNIRTMGFRGEALASIAAIAQVELRTRQIGEALGTLVAIEGMKVIRQEPCATEEGTSIAVKNLFFNVPARRNFLKSDTAELKNIIDEFTRVALAYPNVGFQFFNNDYELFHYRGGNLKQRICAVFNEKYAAQMVAVEENTYALTVTGFCGKPDSAKKTRGEQYIYVNRRFIKSAYLNHAVVNAYEQMIARDSHPFYVLFLDIDPARIDINVHPQKYEIKFDDEKLAYTFVNLAVKHALGAHSVMPSLDFNQEHHLQQNSTFEQSNSWIPPSADSSSRPYTHHSFLPPTPTPRERSNVKNWQDAYNTLQPNENTSVQTSFLSTPIDDDHPDPEASAPYQLQRRYVLTPIKSGFLLIDQQSAHERILFERFITQLAHNRSSSQRQLFPQTVELNATDTLIAQEMLPDVQSLGFDIQEFGVNTFVIHSFPADILPGDERRMLEELIEQYKTNLSIAKLNKRENLARALARSTSIKAGKTLSEQEMRTLIDELFACENPYTSPNGKLTFISMTTDEIALRMENKG